MRGLTEAYAERPRKLNQLRRDEFHGTGSLPFPSADNRKIAAKIVDAPGIESLKAMKAEHRTCKSPG